MKTSIHEFLLDKIFFRISVSGLDKFQVKLRSLMIYKFPGGVEKLMKYIYENIY
jgi:hypothetical protein